MPRSKTTVQPSCPIKRVVREELFTWLIVVPVAIIGYVIFRYFC